MRETRSRRDYARLQSEMLAPRVGVMRKFIPAVITHARAYDTNAFTLRGSFAILVLVARTFLCRPLRSLDVHWRRDGFRRDADIS